MIEGITRSKVISLIHHVVIPLHLQIFIEHLEAWWKEGRHKNELVPVLKGVYDLVGWQMHPQKIKGHK